MPVNPIMPLNPKNAYKPHNAYRSPKPPRDAESSRAGGIFSACPGPGSDPAWPGPLQQRAHGLQGALGV